MFMRLFLGACCTFIPLTARGGPVETLCEFQDGIQPASPLLQDSDGCLYGTTRYGGDFHFGMFFRVSTNGTRTTVASFSLTNGGTPSGPMVSVGNGTFYGTTPGRGAYPLGTVFCITTNGDLSIIASFTGVAGPAPGAQPTGLVVGPDGAFYGTTTRGGANSFGTAFRVTRDGVFKSLRSFRTDDGAFLTPLAVGNDGAFYGATAGGGIAGWGTVFRLTIEGALQRICSFNHTNSGSSPRGRLLAASDGALYGTTYSGGTLGSGTIFRVTTNGSLTPLANFAEGDYSTAGLVEVDGVLYGTSRGEPYPFSGVVFRILPNGSKSEIFSFTKTNGSSPGSDLIVGADGALYGTTFFGGPSGAGTVFRLTTEGELRTLTAFSNDKGSEPLVAPTLDDNGTIYGTTYFGGTSGNGTVFTLTTNGSFSTVSFDGTNGSGPNSPLLQGTDGNFYGTTEGGGDTGDGVLFQFRRDGTLVRLGSFTPSVGRLAGGALAEGDNGAIYGTMRVSGNYYGGVFKWTPTEPLHAIARFQGSTGVSPFAGLIKGLDGAFYGTTWGGGSVANKGTVFRVTPAGQLTTLASFADSISANSRGLLVQDTDGTFYGTTFLGGSYGLGTVFRLTTEGNFSVLASFAGYTNGAYPVGPLTIGSDGSLYGATVGNTLFRVSKHGTITAMVTLASSDLSSTSGGIIMGKDGSFYGNAQWGGQFGGGGIFRVNLFSKLDPPLLTPAGWQISFTGIAANTYLIERATNLSDSWIPLGSVAVGVDGRGQFVDPSPLLSEAYYRTLLSK